MPEPITLVAVGTGLVGLTAELARRYFEIAKEVFDVVVGAIALVVASPVMALGAFGAVGHTIEPIAAPVTGDLIMPNLLPLETQFVPVLLNTITVAAWNTDDESPDVFSCQLQFYDDFSVPTAPAWRNVGSAMSYRDAAGDFGPPGAPADGYWVTQFSGVTGLRDAISKMARARGCFPENSVSTITVNRLFFNSLESGNRFLEGKMFLFKSMFNRPSLLKARISFEFSRGDSGF